MTRSRFWGNLAQTYAASSGKRRAHALDRRRREGRRREEHCGARIGWDVKRSRTCTAAPRASVVVRGGSGPGSRFERCAQFSRVNSSSRPTR